MRHRVPSSVPVALILLGALIAWGEKPAPKTRHEVRFGNLVDGQTVTTPFVVSMIAKNLVVEPAAAGIRKGYGHFHILVDVPAVKAPKPIPFDPQHLHYGKGQTETTLDLPAGMHTLTLQFAKGDHVPYDPPITQTIRVHVVERVVNQVVNPDDSATATKPATDTGNVTGK
jgi:hypothetical protein